MVLDRSHYVTPAKFAAQLGVSDETVRRWARAGRVCAVLLGGRYLIHAKSFSDPERARAETAGLPQPTAK